MLGAISLRHTFYCKPAEKAIHRFAIWNRVARKLISQIIEFKFQPLRQSNGVRNRQGKIAESAVHLPCIAQVALLVNTQQPARLLQVGMVANRSKNIEDFP